MVNHRGFHPSRRQWIRDPGHITCLTGHPTQDRVDFLDLLLVQASRPPGPITFQQSSQPHLFKRMDPILNRSRRVPQQCGRFRARQTLRHEQHTVQSMIVARFFRSSDLVLQSENDRGRVRNAEWSHSSIRPQPHLIRNYL